MIQIIPANPKRSFAEGMGNALGGALSAGLQIYQQNQKQKQLSGALEEVGKIYDNPEMDQQQKFIQAFQKLSQFPEVAEQLGSQLTRLESHKSKAKEFSQKIQQQEQEKKSMFAFGDKLERDHPDDPLYKTIADIYKSGLPANESSNMVKAITGIDPFKMQQQRRLQLDSVLKRYSQRIKEIDDEIKNARINDRAPLIEQKRALQGERDELLGFRSLMDEEEGFEDTEEFDQEDIYQGPKVSFDPNNKGHRAAAEKLYKKYGDKEKVRKVLSKSFKGL